MIIELGARFAAEAEKYSDTYYERRREELGCAGFDVHELAIARWCESNIPKATRMCEVGSGFGQMCLLLAAMGYSVVGVEGDTSRFQAAVAIAQRLGSSATYVQGWYPDSSPPHDLLVITNVVGGWWEMQPGSLKEKLRRFFRRPAVICPRLWWVERGAHEYDVLAREIESAGFVVDRASDEVWYVRSGASNANL